LVGVLAFDITYFGFHEATIPIQHEAEPYYEALPWSSLAFCRQKFTSSTEMWTATGLCHRLDLIMATLIPVFMPMKFIKLINALKTAESGQKIIQKTQELFN
jgi:hypothetical protein